jgi:hypothetical protein
MNQHPHSSNSLSLALAGVLLCACSQAPDSAKRATAASAAAGSTPGSAQPSTAGVQASAATTPSTPLTVTAGATAPTAGTVAKPASTAGSPANAPTGGAPSTIAGTTGGAPLPAAGSNSAGSAAAGTAASTPPLTCEKGKVKASEVIVMGESFYAINPNILNEIEKDANAAGALAMNAHYRNYAVSGQLLTGTIPSQFDKAIGVGPVKVVIMDGGGNDCMSSPCDMCPATFETLLKKMADNKVETVIYTRYPEPGNPPGSLTSLKSNLDVLMPKVEAVCAKTTAPKCHWVDLRPVWKDGDTTDGLHPTVSGGQHVGDAIWAKMMEQCIAQ